MSRETRRQWFAINYIKSRYSHELRTFVAKDMMNNGKEHTTEATTLGQARAAFRQKLKHTAFIIKAEPGFRHIHEKEDDLGTPVRVSPDRLARILGNRKEEADETNVLPSVPPATENVVDRNTGTD